MNASGALMSSRSGAVGPEAFVVPLATEETWPGMSSERRKAPPSARLVPRGPLPFQSQRMRDGICGSWNQSCVAKQEDKYEQWR